LLKSKEVNKNWNSNRKYKQEINTIANEYLKEKKRKEERRKKKRESCERHEQGRYE
jgi:hypothetical protein